MTGTPGLVVADMQVPPDLSLRLAALVLTPPCLTLRDLPDLPGLCLCRLRLSGLRRPLSRCVSLHRLPDPPRLRLCRPRHPDLVGLCLCLCLCLSGLRRPLPRCVSLHRLPDPPRLRLCRPRHPDLAGLCPCLPGLCPCLPGLCPCLPGRRLPSPCGSPLSLPGLPRLRLCVPLRPDLRDLRDLRLITAGLRLSPCLDLPNLNLSRLTLPRLCLRLPCLSSPNRLVPCLQLPRVSLPGPHLTCMRPPVLPPAEPLSRRQSLLSHAAPDPH
ncbi:hypothetical protein [Streptomyces sp. NPDC088196]|uniref:hypothetical protein n=1 Tax=Streptomyces sp. NPDC088196 TaxID=3154868 RepID=UPI003450F990